MSEALDSLTVASQGRPGLRERREGERDGKEKKRKGGRHEGREGGGKGLNLCRKFYEY